MADVSAEDFCLDPDAVEAAIGTRTAAILPVHLYGQLADMRRLGELAERSGLAVVEDACQGHGAERDGLTPGSAGPACFSFYPTKALGAIGDAGAVTGRGPELEPLIRASRDHGQRVKGTHDLVGGTFRLDTIQAAVLLAKLPTLDWAIAERREIASRYMEGLAAVDGLGLPPVPVGSQPAWYVFPVRVADPVDFASHLSARRIGSGRHYPKPVHRQPAWQELGLAASSCPAAEELCARAVSLPLFPGLEISDQERVIETVREYCGQS